MARYSRRRAPTVDFPLTTLFSPVPQTAITRFLDDGEVLALFFVRFTNPAAGTRRCDARLEVDGASQQFGEISLDIATARFVKASGSDFRTVAAGLHTFQLLARTEIADGSLIPAQECSLTIIQLPLWDSDADLL